MGFGFGRGVSLGVARDFTASMPMMELSTTAGLGGATEEKAVVNRVSETNVQVQGIDEPDIVKTDGNEIYYSNQSYVFDVEPRTMMEPSEIGEQMDIAPAPRYRGVTLGINALPLDKLGINAEIDGIGNLLLQDNVLVVFNNDGLQAYDVVDPAEPKELWDLDYADKNYLAGARLYGDEIYFITKTRVSEYSPCPIEPFAVNGVSMPITCGQIYHPVAPAPVDTTYNVAVINMKDGAVKNQVSFLGSSSRSNLYMSTENIYLSYFSPVDTLKVMLNLFEASSDVLPAELIAKIKTVANYDISTQAKMTELQQLIAKYMNALDSDEQMRIENELENRTKDFVEDNLRALEETGIVKISVKDLEVKANGMVPGHLLNQFSMDEYKGNLRVATTIGDSWSASINDVYVLDKNMKTIGSALDMGEDERIYSVRFIEDKGYVVTFKQTDPFYVLDLSNPKDPEITGELKIPGYSAYLHPLAENMILGVGKEDQYVKISLFDVSDPTKPVEKDKYSLKAYWSDVINTHHAYLQDDKYEVFYLPSNEGGYIFSFAGNEFELVKTVSGVRAERAVFINDNLYVIGQNKMVVLDEKTWERVGELDFK
jgi:uncharacterized secreted protein with C-terminal beta-propeller domain